MLAQHPFALSVSKGPGASAWLGRLAANGEWV